MDAITNFLGIFNDYIYQWILIPVLVGTGLYFTFRSRALQVRLFGKMLKVIAGSRDAEKGQISSFQAFAMGLAARVGTGNIAGVAIAIVLGGPGAVFWMWLVALIGMATAFVEAALAQLFKVPWYDGTFRGGPAYYIWKGLKSWKWGAAFAVSLLFTYGIAFEFVQSNTFADTLKSTYGVNPIYTGIAMAIITAVVILGGIKSVAKVTELMAPLMALVYCFLALVIIFIHFDQIIPVFSSIFASAFGLDTAAAGTAGGFLAALLNGTKRGLYSNEAGMGSAPNAASTATTIHPARQGLLQSMGVFVDTILVCSATAFIILVSGLYTPGQESKLEGAALTIKSMSSTLGSWVEPVMTVLIFFFCFSTVIGNYVYAEVNMNYLFPRSQKATLLLRLTVVAAAYIGAVTKLSFVWTLADTSMFFMSIINLIAILLLSKWAFGLLKDYEVGGGESAFVSEGNTYLPGEIAESIWTRADAGKAH